MARRRGAPMDFTGVEPGGFPVVAEGDYNVALQEAYIYTKPETGNDVLALVMAIEDSADWEGQNLFINHALTTKSRPFVLETLMGLGIVTPEDRGEDGRGRVVLDYEVETGENFRKQEVDMVTGFVVNDKVRSPRNRQGVATVIHEAVERRGTDGTIRTVTQARVSRLVHTADEESEPAAGKRQRRKFGR